MIRQRWELDDCPLIESFVLSDAFHWKLGGDFYAGKKIDDETFGVLLIDGEGHGVAGSLHTLPLMAAFELVYNSHSAAHVIGHLVKAAGALGVRGSAIYSIFISVQEKIWMITASAGHEGLIHFKKHDRDQWTVDHVPGSQATMFGHPKPVPAMDSRTELSKGDLIIGYTDGVAEQHSEFDATRIKAVVLNLLHEKETNPNVIAKAIMQESKQAYPHGFDDDATVFVVRVK